jgi:hypothetical protein
MGERYLPARNTAMAGSRSSSVSMG